MKILANDKVAEVQKISVRKKEGMAETKDNLGVTKTVKIMNGKHEGKYAIFEAGSLRKIKAAGVTKHLAILDEMHCFCELESDETKDFIE